MQVSINFKIFYLDFFFGEFQKFTRKIETFAQSGW